jgi:hypothetical protein
MINKFTSLPTWAFIMSSTKTELGTKDNKTRRKKKQEVLDTQGTYCIEKREEEKEGESKKEKGKLKEN